MQDMPRRGLPSLVSVVSPVFNEEGGIADFVGRVHEALEDFEHEVVLVDDGSDDATPAVLFDLARSDERIRVVVLSRNFGQPAATSAGLEHARGEVCVTIDSDLQDPPEVIPEMITRWRLGADVVFAVRSSRSGETRLKLVTARLFYRVFSRLAQVPLEIDAGDFRLLGRPALEALLAMPERTRFLRGMTTWVGFTRSSVSYERDPRFAGSSHYRFGRLTRMATDGIVSFSHRPLQAATLLGFVVSFVAFLMAVALFVLRLTGDYLVGFSTTNILVLLLGGIQLITLGVIGEYLAKVYDEVKQRPLFVVRDRWNLGEQERFSSMSKAIPAVYPPREDPASVQQVREDEDRA